MNQIAQNKVGNRTVKQQAQTVAKASMQRVQTKGESRERGVVAESLKDQSSNIHEEARMVLPGVQALFGFQLIAAFNQRFSQLDECDAAIYLAALIVVAMVAGLVMTPAAYHRLSERDVVSKYFTVLSSRLIAAAMIGLAVAIGADVYIVARMVGLRLQAAVMLGAATILALLCLWIAFPLWHRARVPRRH
jgi:hypothetical protein